MHIKKSTNPTTNQRIRIVINNFSCMHMGDHQKIHPVEDIESKPTMPLVPNVSSKSSERGDPINSHQNIPPPPRPPLPLSRAMRPPHKKNLCCKCICWTISLILLLLLILLATVVILYLVFQPKLPNYSVDRLQISDLRLNLDASLYARFDVKITAHNPNKKIGIYYGKGSHISVWYAKTKLCKGTLPKFYQGHENTTRLDVVLTGQTQAGSGLMSAIQEQQQTGRVPLDLKVDVPVSIKLGRMKLKKVRILGTCLLIVDSLSANNLISIKASSCKFHFKL